MQRYNPAADGTRGYVDGGFGTRLLVNRTTQQSPTFFLSSTENVGDYYLYTSTMTQINIYRQRNTWREDCSDTIRMLSFEDTSLRSLSAVY